MEKINLIHLANFNSTNIGNGALISGLESTMNEDFEGSINWLREPWDNYTFKDLDFDSGFVEKVNSSDGLVVGGAVAFNGRDYNDRTGSRFELPFDLWPKIEKPIIFYGLSYRHWEGQTYHHLDKLKTFVKLCLETENITLTVRNDGTKEWMGKTLELDISSVKEVPDSAVFVENTGDSSYYPELKEDKRNVILSFNDEDAVSRFGQKYKTDLPYSEARIRAIDGYVETIEALASNYKDLNFILCPHYFDDYKMMSDFLEKVTPKVAHQRMVSTGLNSVKDTSYFYGRYFKADMAISMRVHSMSPSIGLNTPMVAYTTQDRMENFMKRIGLENAMVDAFDVNCGDKLRERAFYTMENKKEVKSNFSEVRDNLRSEARKFHLELRELLS